MEKNCLRQLETPIASIFTEKKNDFLRGIAHPLLDRNVKLGPKFFHDYLSWDRLYLGVTLGILP